MSDCVFLAYLPDPFGVRKAAYFLGRSEGVPSAIKAEELSDYSGRVVTYDCSTLVDELERAGLPPPRHLIDASDALRLCIGIPRDEGGGRQWNLWSRLLHYFPNIDNARLFKELFESKSDWPDDDGLTSLLVNAVIALRSMWDDLIKQLGVAGELERFLNIEVPVQRIFNHRQFAGIRINKEVASQLIQTVRDEKYSAYREVASALNRSPSGLNFWNVHNELASTDVRHLMDIEDGGRLREAFKLAAFHSQFARNFLAYVDATRDEAIIRQVIGSEGRLHPVFSVMGTVTGRVLVTDPYLQQLRRKYRGLIAADTGFKLYYLDYSQFEPGIVAFLSQDKNLIDAYNRGDVYSALSETVFGSGQFRPLSKRIYLAFCYGMSPEGIARLISGAEASDTETATYRDAINGFFSKFPGLEKLRDLSQITLLKNRWVESLFGNKRYRITGGSLTAKEKRWALNQRVQASASLIFKEALILLEEEFGNGSILLPMHDAVLMQLESSEETQTMVRRAVSNMQRAFSSRCPGIEVRVTVGPFAD